MCTKLLIRIHAFLVFSNANVCLMSFNKLFINRACPPFTEKFWTSVFVQTSNLALRDRYKIFHGKHLAYGYYFEITIPIEFSFYLAIFKRGIGKSKNRGIKELGNRRTGKLVSVSAIPRFFNLPLSRRLSLKGGTGNRETGESGSTVRDNALHS